MTSSTAQRFSASIESFGAIVLDAIEASRAMHTAHSSGARRVVLDRFAAESARHAERNAA